MYSGWSETTGQFAFKAGKYVFQGEYEKREDEISAKKVQPPSLLKLLRETEG